MRTIYITGIKKYQDSILKGLKKSDLREGKDFIQGANGIDFALLWIKDEMELRTLKKAIGTKYVWKHRMRFHETYDELQPIVSDELTQDDMAFIKRMRKEMALID